MASPARWVHEVRLEDSVITVKLGPNRHTVSVVTRLEELPRQDLRRVLGHLGYKSPMQESNEIIIARVRAHVGRAGNVESSGRVRSNLEGRSSAVDDSPTTSASSEVPSSVEERPAPRTSSTDSLTREVEAIVDRRLDEHGVTASAALDVEEVKRIALSVLPVPRVYEVGGVEVGRVEGRLHRDFDEMLERVSTWENLFLTGGPGVGKTHVTSQVAKALGVECVVLSAKPLPQDSEIMGYHNPLTGAAIRGSVRRVYEFGGVYVFDEIDTAHVSLGTSTNKLLSSPTFHFPIDGGGFEEVERHPKCVFMATGNTYGQGGDHRFMGTTRMNGASLDRFTFMHVDCDTDLVRGILEDTDTANGTRFAPRAFEIWSTARANIERYRLDVVCSPRAAFAIHKFMIKGLSEWASCRGRLFGRGAGADNEAKILEGITLEGARS